MDLSQSVAAIVAAVLTLFPQPAEARSDWLHTGQMPTDSEVIQKMQAEEAAKRTAEALQEAAAQQPERAVAVAPPANRARSQATTEDVLACIRRYESGGDYGAVSSSGRYRGAYQMDRSFWLTYGGDPHWVGQVERAPRALQDAVASRGLASRGLAPWPLPSRKCS